jgi:chemotaxis protein MotB
MNKLIISIKSIHCIIYASLFFLLVLSGCVSTSKYQSLKTEHDLLQDEKVELEESNRKLKLEADDLKNKSRDLARLNEDQEQMEVEIAELKEAIEVKTLQVDFLEDTLKVNLVDKLFFKTGSAEVSRKGKKTLARIAPILKDAKDKEIRVVGHCDNLPPGIELSKKYRTNWELSVARATAIVQILQWGHGIDPSRMVAEGVAHYKPINTGNKKKDRASNRVVEIFLTPAPIKTMDQ